MDLWLFVLNFLMVLWSIVCLWWSLQLMVWICLGFAAVFNVYFVGNNTENLLINLFRCIWADSMVKSSGITISTKNIDTFPKRDYGNVAGVSCKTVSVFCFLMKVNDRLVYIKQKFINLIIYQTKVFEDCNWLLFAKPKLYVHNFCLNIFRFGFEWNWFQLQRLGCHVCIIW